MITKGVYCVLFCRNPVDHITDHLPFRSIRKQWTGEHRRARFSERKGAEKAIFSGNCLHRFVWDVEAGSSSLPTPTIMWRQKRCLLRKARIYRAFLLPKRRFFSVPKRRCKIAVFPLWIDLNSRKVNIRYTGR